MANKHTKECSTSVIIRQMQMKTMMKCPLTPGQMANIINQQKMNAGEGVEKREPSCTAGGNAH